jgi:hypothetical protein
MLWPSWMARSVATDTTTHSPLGALGGAVGDGHRFPAQIRSFTCYLTHSSAVTRHHSSLTLQLSHPTTTPLAAMAAQDILPTIILIGILYALYKWLTGPSTSPPVARAVSLHLHQPSTPLRPALILLGWPAAVTRSQAQAA